MLEYTINYKIIHNDTILDVFTKKSRNKIFLCANEVTLIMSCNFLVGNVIVELLSKYCLNDKIEWKLWGKLLRILFEAK